MGGGLIVGCIPYLNLLPYYHGGPLGRMPCVEAPPRQLGELVLSGKVDAAPLAVVDTWRWEEKLQPIGDLGLACSGPVKSVLLFSRRPLVELDGCLVRVTSESSTSAVLLRLLMAEKYGFSGVRFERGEGGGEAFLVIGDQALRLKDDPPGRYPFVFDLGEEWTSWTGKPFVFARWVARRACARDEVEALGEALCRRLAANLASLGKLAAASRAGFSPERVERYLARFRYHLDADDLAGSELFRHRVSDNGAMA